MSSCVNASLCIQRDHERLVLAHEALQGLAMGHHAGTGSQNESIASFHAMRRMPRTAGLAAVHLATGFHSLDAEPLSTDGTQVLDHRENLGFAVARIAQHLLHVSGMDAVKSREIMIRDSIPIRGGVASA